MLCAFMCSYSTLPMIGTGCGISTDHLARSGVIGNGASPRCGMPASLATLETAMLGGVVDEPMMMSALDSVTKRRALVVAVVGSPPSSSTMTLSGTPPISLATNSSALRSGMPSAAAGPVVGIEMPMTISLVCASAGQPGSASDAAITAADRKSFFIGSSLLFSVQTRSKFSGRFSPFFRSCSGLVSALHEPCDDFLRHRRRFQPGRVIRVAADQHPGLERLDRQRVGLEHLVGDLEARPLETLDPAFDRYPVAMGRGDMEFGPGIHHGNADQAVFLHDILLGEARGLEHDRGRVVEHLEVARIIHDVGGVAVAPLNLHIAAVDEHGFTPSRYWSGRFESRQHDNGGPCTSPVGRGRREASGEGLRLP